MAGILCCCQSNLGDPFASCTSSVREVGGTGTRYRVFVFDAVEKWHFRNHVGEFCKKNCNPKDYPEVETYNTVICEQRFKWISKYKGMTKINMSATTFNFLLLLLCWLDHEEYESPYTATV